MSETMTVNIFCCENKCCETRQTIERAILMGRFNARNWMTWKKDHFHVHNHLYAFILEEQSVYRDFDTIHTRNNTQTHRFLRKLFIKEIVQKTRHLKSLYLENAVTYCVHSKTNL